MAKHELTPEEVQQVKALGERAGVLAREQYAISQRLNGMLRADQDGSEEDRNCAILSLYERWRTHALNRPSDPRDVLQRRL